MTLAQGRNGSESGQLLLPVIGEHPPGNAIKWSAPRTRVSATGAVVGHQPEYTRSISNDGNPAVRRSRVHDE